MKPWYRIYTTPLTGWNIYGNEVSKTYFFWKQTLSPDFWGEKTILLVDFASAAKIILTIREDFLNLCVKKTYSYRFFLYICFFYNFFLKNNVFGCFQVFRLHWWWKSQSQAGFFTHLFFLHFSYKNSLFGRQGCSTFLLDFSLIFNFAIVIIMRVTHSIHWKSKCFIPNII